jgi:hypothetical protein
MALNTKLLSNYFGESGADLSGNSTMNSTKRVDRTRRMRTLLFVSILFCHVSLVSAAQMTSCDHVKQFFKEPLSSNLFARQLALEQAVGVIERADPQCDTWLSEWARWSFGNTLDEYSRSPGFSSDVSQSWATKAANAYEAYLRWFADLDADARREMIAILTKTKTSASDFPKKELAWLRTRVGGALLSLGSIYVRTGKQSILLRTYSQFAEASPVVFSQEAVLEWHKWLQAQQEFTRQKSKEEIRSLIAESVECASSWQLFGGFLQQFVLQNPSVAGTWKKVLEDLKQWLS